MNKCLNCGKEYEGGFCPCCGSLMREEILPTVNKPEKSLIIPQKYAAASMLSPNEQLFAKILTALKSGYSLALVIFSSLLFVFMALPVVIEPETGISCGSVYTMTTGILSEITEVKAAMIFLIALTAFTFAYAVTVLLLRLSYAVKFKHLKLFGKHDLKLPELLDYLGFAFYIIFFVIGCAVCGEIASTDGGMGIMKAGACSVLIIVFSLIFAIIGIGTCIVRNILKKNNPEYAERESEIDRTEFKKFKQYVYNLSTLVAPVKPQKVGKPNPPVSAVKIVKSKRTAEITGLLYIISAAASFCWIELGDYHRIADVMGLINMAVPALVFVISFFVPLKKLSKDKFYYQKLVITIIIFVALTAITFTLCEIFISYDWLDYEIKYMIEKNIFYGEIHYDVKIRIYTIDEVIFTRNCCIALIIFTIICGLLSVIYSIRVLRKLKGIRKDEGKYEVMERELDEYEEKKQEYQNYIVQHKNYRKQLYFYNRKIIKYNQYVNLL